MDKKKKWLLAAVAGYLGALLPGTKGRPKILSTKYFAHRGLYNNSGSAPENTMAAFRVT